ncbi:MAG: leucine-rich repeat protein [Clostridia bacterium]|nr:leucine-rich repeat protein [Clostridia bacterium]
MSGSPIARAAVSLSADSTRDGDTVTVDLGLNPGTQLVGLTVYKAGSTSETVPVSGSGSRYTFTMPGCGVTVSATFEYINYGVTVVTFTPDTRIGVSTQTAPTATAPVIVTRGQRGHGAAGFFSDVTGCPAAVRGGEICLISLPAFVPDFTLPIGLTEVEAEAFQGIAVSVVDVPENCTIIGDHAFRNCPNLTQIRIPAGCALGKDVFDGCALVYVYGTAGSDAEAYCSAHANCVFVPEE